MPGDQDQMPDAPDRDAPGDAGGAPVLVVDLDGTLCRTDTLEEGILRLAARDPLALRHLPRWLAAGRAALKAEVTDRGVLPAETLPLDEAVLEILRAARNEGRRTALVSAADHRQVTEVAAATGLFDEAYGSADGLNLKGPEKARFLTDRYGETGFHYIGDSMADLPVWAAARQGFTLHAGPGLRARTDAEVPGIVHLSPPSGRLSAMLRALRPHQWSKNALLFLPILAAHDFSTLWLVVLGFLAFSAAASAVYVLNDLVDLADDRAHPRKRNRPFASGELSARTGVTMAAGLFLAALILTLVTGSAAFLGVLALYVALTFAYSFWLKRKLLVDVLTLAGLYTIRVIAGGVVAGVALSPWMLGFSGFLFLCLAAVKRQAELTDLLSSARESSRAYRVDDLPVLRGIAISAANATVLVLALYISSEDVQTLYPRPELLWLICPLLLYWMLRMVMKTHRGLMTDDPIVFAATDRVSLLLVIACATIALTAAL